MAPTRRGRDWPVPDAIYQIKTILTNENGNETNLLAVSTNQGLGEVSLEDRDKAVRLLKLFRWWFNLPPSVFFTATNILDRFLTKMKVQRRYLSCLVVSCLVTASKLHKRNIDPKSLVTISQSKFSIRDIDRMSDIVYKKLDLGVGKQFVNAFDYLNQFLALLETVAVQFGIKPLFKLMLKKGTLITHLEVIMCNSECASVKPPIIALALIQIQFERFLSKEIPYKSSYYSIETLQLVTTLVDLQLICLIAPDDFTSCHTKITEVLQNYDNHIKVGNYMNSKRNNSRPMYTKSYWRQLNTLHSILEE